MVPPRDEFLPFDAEPPPEEAAGVLPWRDGDDAAVEAAAARPAAPYGGASRVAETPPPPPREPLDPEEAFGRVTTEVERVWGFESLRPLQEQAIRAALSDRDLLLVLPTGGGKSLCYQAPALVRGGLTLVVSPLISLMKDQVDGLTQNGVRAAMLSSAQDVGELREVHRALDERRLDLLFVSPERLAVRGFLDRLDALGLAAVAVDEAHCISHWGHDFRPEYRQLGELRRTRGHLAIHAYTATATRAVRDDIVAQLGLSDPEVLVAPCDRPNLTYRVRQRSDLAAQVREVVARHAGEAGIVYCLSRKDTEQVARDLAAAGVRCAAYHAGLGADVRRDVQDRFQEERLDVVVATVAFGMGIDRPDVRFVIHASLPKGVEQYSQETGRAGRDGLPSECVMFYSASDFHSWRHLIERSAEEGDGETDAATVEAALDRLSRMLRFATGGVCRHRALVEYFGQTLEPREDGGGCGACDVCLNELESVDDGLALAQKILSCVVHCEQRYGASHVADVLRGANTAGIRRAHHEELATFGILAAHTTRELRAWIDQLVGQELLRVAPGRYPTLSLSPRGAEVLEGEREVELVAVPRPASKPSRSQSRSREALLDEARAGSAREDDAELFEHLRRTRRDLARERAVPPYIICSDRTLAHLVALRPTTELELSGVKGIGEKKAADIGPLLLEAIAAFERGAAAS